MFVLFVNNIRMRVDPSVEFLQQEASKYPGCEIRIEPVEVDDLLEFQTAGLNKLPNDVSISPTHSDEDFDFADIGELPEDV